MSCHFVNTHMLRRRDRIKFLQSQIFKLSLVNTVNRLVIQSQEPPCFLIRGNRREPVNLIGKASRKTTGKPHGFCRLLHIAPSAWVRGEKLFCRLLPDLQQSWCLCCGQMFREYFRIRSKQGPYLFLATKRCICSHIHDLLSLLLDNLKYPKAL